MNAIAEWALRHGVSAAALQDLVDVLTAPDRVQLQRGESEAAVTSQMRLDESRAGKRLWRNNVGALKNDQNRLIRYGLANDSAAMNKRLKSGDWIGIEPVTITHDMVGSVFGRFVSREVKRAGWKYAGTEREQAQANWIAVINMLGGDARFVTGEIRGD